MSYPLNSMSNKDKTILASLNERHPMIIDKSKIGKKERKNICVHFNHLNTQHRFIKASILDNVNLPRASRML
ncbi:hypothetical protein ALC56_04270 [Trachymyrmex septentrionalis]|uniref:Uncharacterized protein n=1 Tax=Trachymyrmex septentrionalis TaxID=34720 RepID=A0A195FMC8_9HYME|nr:hypothetical protein ALC56_04270 [Trachymyrmex septentrionalis]